MPWVSVDDAFYEHPKFARAGPLGIALWLAGLAYCNRNLTDGFIPWSRAHTLLSWEMLLPCGDGRERVAIIELSMKPHPDAEFAPGGETISGEMVARFLVDAGLWSEVGGGYKVHDYHDYQLSKAMVLKRRDVTRERVARWRGNTPRSSVTTHDVTALVTVPPLPHPKEESEDVGGDGGGSDVGDVAAQEKLMADKSAERVRKPSPNRNGTTPDGFETWYRTLYPRRVKPDLAERAYRAALRRGHTVAEIHDGTRSWAEHWEQIATEMQHIPYPASFLNGGQFRDPPPESGVLDLEAPL